jgi:hypothetical protein
VLILWFGQIIHNGFIDGETFNENITSARDKIYTHYNGLLECLNGSLSLVFIFEDKLIRGPTRAHRKEQHIWPRARLQHSYAMPFFFIIICGARSNAPSIIYRLASARGADTLERREYKCQNGHLNKCYKCWLCVGDGYLNPPLSPC